MTKLGLTAFCLGTLTLIGCSQVPTSATKAPPDKADTVQTQPPAYVPGYGPPTGPTGPGQPVVSGSFPRSFLIPGTNTSLRVGGLANVVVQE